MKLLRITLLLTLIACLVFQDVGAADAMVDVGVLTFGAGDAHVSDRQAGVITNIFIGTLSSSPGVAVYERRWLDAIGREMRTGKSWLVDPSVAAMIGKMAGLRYIVTGNVALQSVSGKAAGRKGVALYGTDSAVSAAIDVRVIDTETALVLFSHRAVGYAENPRDALSGGVVRYTKTGLKSHQEQAVVAAVGQVVAAVLEDLGGIVLQAAPQPQYVPQPPYQQPGGIQPQSQYSGVPSQQQQLYSRTQSLPPQPQYAQQPPYQQPGGLQPQNQYSGMPSQQQQPYSRPQSSPPQPQYAQQPPYQQPGGIQPQSQYSGVPSQQQHLYSRPQSLPQQQPQYAQQPQYQQSGGLQPLGLSPQEQSYQLSGGLQQQSQSRGMTQQQQYRQTAPQVQPQSGPPQYRQPGTGSDANRATDPSIVYSFPLDRNAAASLEDRQRKAQNMLAGGNHLEAYTEFRKLAEAHDFDYLSAYWAGVAVMRMNKPTAAAAWFDRALSINPSYQPAIDARAGLNAK
jgi:curli biogenesis system outer membrane secretion channel CsgG